MELKQLVVLALQVSIMCTVFGFGLDARVTDTLHLLRQPGLLLRSIIAVFVVMPVVTLALTYVFDFRPTLEIALIALAVSPIPPLLPRKSAKAGDRDSYALGLMIVLAALAIVITPIAVQILGHVSSRTYTLAPRDVATIVLKTAILPLAAGVALRTFAPGIADSLKKPVGWIVKILFPLAVLLLLVGSWRAMVTALGEATLPAIAMFVAAGLCAGHLLGRPEPGHSKVLALATASRHPAIALSIVSANFPQERFGGTILLYLLVCGVVCLPYLAWQRRRQSR
jgi:BASS family bile acid:Na+ symporter